MPTRPVASLIPWLAGSCLLLAAAAPAQDPPARAAGRARPNPTAKATDGATPRGGASRAGRSAGRGRAAPAAATSADAAGASDGVLLVTLDRDGDGSLSGLEIDLAVVSLRALDRDHDGTVSPAEMGRAAAAPAQAPASPRGQTPSAGDGAVGVGPFHDGDGDGRITAADLGPKLQEVFPKLDTNADGALDAAEQAAAVSAAQSKGAGAGPPKGKARSKSDAPRGAAQR